MIDSAPSRVEIEERQIKVKPFNLQTYATKEASLRKLPKNQIIKEGGKEYFEFSFSNGLKVITDTFEESVKFSEEKDSQNKYLRVRKFLVNFQGKEVDLLDNELARHCDHYISFRASLIGSHFNRQVVVIDGKDQEIERHKSNVVIYVPENEERTDYNGEEMFYHWVHELGHALDLIDLVRKFRKVDNGSIQYECVNNGKLNQIKAERNAHAIGLMILKGIRKRYGSHPSFSEKRYINSVVESALHSRQVCSMDFRTAYSNQDRALFRDEEIEIIKRGITEEADRENFQLEFRREKNTSLLKEKFGDKAAKKYDSLVQKWISKSLQKMFDINKELAENGWGKIKTKEEVRKDLELGYHEAIIRKYGIPWEQFSRLYHKKFRLW